MQFPAGAHAAAASVTQHDNRSSFFTGALTLTLTLSLEGRGDLSDELAGG